MRKQIMNISKHKNKLLSTSTNNYLVFIIHHDIVETPHPADVLPFFHPLLTQLLDPVLPDLLCTCVHIVTSPLGICKSIIVCVCKLPVEIHVNYFLQCIRILNWSIEVNCCLEDYLSCNIGLFPVQKRCPANQISSCGKGLFIITSKQVFMIRMFTYLIVFYFNSCLVM